jgi:hypothetical protein
VSRFKDLHPGGASVFFEPGIGALASLCRLCYLHQLLCSIAGQDATEAFYGLHRHDVITKPQYARLQIGAIASEKSVIHSKISGELSKVPYAEPTWLSEGYYSPYYKDVNLFFFLCEEHKS